MNASSFLWLLLSAFLFFAYIMVMSQILIDLFRDQELGGGKKALWIIALILFPYITALVYIVTRGKGMAQRYREATQRNREEAAAFLRESTGATSVDQIARAKALLDQGAINNDEFVALKRGALAHVSG